MKKWLYIFLVWNWCLCAENRLEDNAPLLHGIVIVNSPIDLAQQEDQKGVFIQTSIPGKKTLLKDLLACYLEEPITQQRMLEIKRTIIQYCKDQSRPLVTVQIPEQDISSGVVQIVLKEGIVEKISYSGNRWFSDAFMEQHICLREGEKINEDQLLNDVAWLNRNPFHMTNIILSPGKKENSVDVLLKTQDKFPLRFYLGGDNTGTKFTEDARMYLGANWGHAFWHGDLLSYQYTTSFDFDRFQAHTGSYTAYLPWKHELDLFGGYSKVRSKIDDFKSGGDSGQISIRYKVPFKPLYKSELHTLCFGFDYKTMNSNLLFIGGDEQPVIDNTVNITQFTGEYEYVNLFGSHDITLLLDLFYSPGQMVSKQKASDYEAYRPDAKSNYIYGFVSLEDIYSWKWGEIGGKFRGQVASRALLPSEQFGLGGYSTVRGYDEREYNADDALCLNLEARTLPWKYERWNLESLFLVFVDYGLGHLKKPNSDEKSVENLIGIGPGIRIRAFPYVTLRVDYGFQLHHTRLGDHDFGKWHINAFISY